MFTTIKNSFLSVGTLGLVSLGSLVYAPVTLAVDIDLSSWQQAGDVIKNPSNATLTNAYSGLGEDGDDPNGYFHINNNSNTDPLLSGSGNKTIEKFLGIAAGSLPNMNTDNGIREGSAIRGNITANQGDIFKFTYNFRTNEPLRETPPENDYAFVTINGNILSPLLATVDDANINDAGFAKQTGNKTFEYIFQNAGNFDVSLGVVDVQGFGYSSSLTVLNPTLQSAADSGVQPVPEPMTIIGSMFALGCGTALRRRFGKIAK